jgi:hypothetical protein
MVLMRRVDPYVDREINFLELSDGETITGSDFI